MRRSNILKTSSLTFEKGFKVSFRFDSPFQRKSTKRPSSCSSNSNKRVISIPVSYNGMWLENASVSREESRLDVWVWYRDCRHCFWAAFSFVKKRGKRNSFLRISPTTARHVWVNRQWFHQLLPNFPDYQIARFYKDTVLAQWQQSPAGLVVCKNTIAVLLRIARNVEVTSSARHNGTKPRKNTPFLGSIHLLFSTSGFTRRQFRK